MAVTNLIKALQDKHLVKSKAGAKRLIQAGAVTVNGTVIKALKFTVDEAADAIAVTATDAAIAAQAKAPKVPRVKTPKAPKAAKGSVDWAAAGRKAWATRMANLAAKADAQKPAKAKRVRKPAAVAEAAHA